MSGEAERGATLDIAAIRALCHEPGGKGCCAAGYKITGDACTKCGATDDEACRIRVRQVFELAERVPALCDEVERQRAENAMLLGREAIAFEQCATVAERITEAVLIYTSTDENAEIHYRTGAHDAGAMLARAFRDRANAARDLLEQKP